MDRLKLPLILGFLALLAACSPNKSDTSTPAPPVVLPPTPTEQTFSTPYFPSKDTSILGQPLAFWSAEWTAGCVYGPDQWNQTQKTFVAGLQPAGGEGEVAAGFSTDFDGDGRAETVAYGAWAKASGDEGNFVLVTRSGPDKPEILLLKELPGPPRFTVFTKKPDGSLWFGGGIDAGEVTMKIVWDQGQPVFSVLGLD